MDWPGSPSQDECCLRWVEHRTIIRNLLSLLPTEHVITTGVRASVVTALGTILFGGENERRSLARGNFIPNRSHRRN